VTTYLVTGGAGFIGSHLCDRLLAEEHRVIAVDDLSSGHLSNIAEARGYGHAFTFYNVDIRAEGLGGLFERHRPEVVFHLAAQHRAEVRNEPPADLRVGIMGLLAVLDAAVGAGVRKVVFASSASVYGRVRRLPVKETALVGSRPLTPGAISKKAAEDYLRFYRRSHGLDFTSVVLGSTYGPRQAPPGPGVVGAFVEAMLAGLRPEIFGDGTQTRDFLFVDDAVHALALSVDRGPGKTINVGTGVETSVIGLYGMLATITGFKGDPMLGPQPPGEVLRSCLDNELAERELGWKPWTHLEDGLRETVAYVRPLIGLP
jgi:UDP-glucose 4-epimerase